MLRRFDQSVTSRFVTDPNFSSISKFFLILKIKINHSECGSNCTSPSPVLTGPKRRPSQLCEHLEHLFRHDVMATSGAGDTLDQEKPVLSCCTANRSSEPCVTGACGASGGCGANSVPRSSFSANDVPGSANGQQRKSDTGQQATGRSEQQQQRRPWRFSLRNVHFNFKSTSRWRPRVECRTQWRHTRGKRTTFVVPIRNFDWSVPTLLINCVFCSIVFVFVSVRACDLLILYIQTVFRCWFNSIFRRLCTYMHIHTRVHIVTIKIDVLNILYVDPSKVKECFFLVCILLKSTIINIY